MVPWTHMSQPPKRHLHRFSRFCKTHPCDQHTDRQTGRQTTLRVTWVAIGHIYAMHAMRSNNNNYYYYFTFVSYNTTTNYYSQLSVAVVDSAAKGQRQITS